MTEEIRSIQDSDGTRKELRIEKAENGFVITISTDSKNSEGEWQYDSKKYISGTHPLAKKEDNSGLDMAIDVFLTDLKLT